MSSPNGSMGEPHDLRLIGIGEFRTNEQSAVPYYEELTTLGTPHGVNSPGNTEIERAPPLPPRPLTLQQPPTHSSMTVDRRSSPPPQLPPLPPPPSEETQQEPLQPHNNNISSAEEHNNSCYYYNAAAPEQPYPHPMPEQSNAALYQPPHSSWASYAHTYSYDQYHALAMELEVTKRQLHMANRANEFLNSNLAECCHTLKSQADTIDRLTAAAAAATTDAAAASGSSSRAHKRTIEDHRHYIIGRRNYLSSLSGGAGAGSAPPPDLSVIPPPSPQIPTTTSEDLVPSSNQRPSQNISAEQRGLGAHQKGVNQCLFCGAIFRASYTINRHLKNLHKQGTPNMIFAHPEFPRIFFVKTIAPYRVCPERLRLPNSLLVGTTGVKWGTWVVERGEESEGEDLSE